MTATRCEPKFIPVARNVVLKVLSETPVLVSTEGEDQVEKVPNDNVGRKYLCMMAKGILHI